MKLSDYTRQQGVRYETAWRWFRDENIQGWHVGAHTILIDVPASVSVPSSKFHTSGREIEVVNQAKISKEELFSDLISIVYSFCVRLYGQRRAKRQTELLVQELEADHAPG